jgi:hypothetical protein
MSSKQLLTYNAILQLLLMFPIGPNLIIEWSSSNGSYGELFTFVIVVFF